ncbi:MAG: EamA family transporter [Chloroflexi bacterium]|nr:EamA family transporter [Chloroflexota bacterium]
MHTAEPPKRPRLRALASPHTRAALQALFVTLLWSTSWVLIKIGLREIPALTFAGLRYVLGFFCLLPFALRPDRRACLRRLDRHGAVRFILLGVLIYAVMPGSHYLGLVYLPAVTVNLLQNTTAIFVALMGIRLLGEQPTTRQWAGVAVFMLGLLTYLGPVPPPQSQALGLLIVMIGVVCNAAGAVLGRSINRAGSFPPVTVTAVSMGVGGFLLLAVGLAAHGWPTLTPQHWAIILWLAVVSSALAYTLWNESLRVLSAAESSILNNTMLIYIAILAWVFLGEALDPRQLLGMGVAAAGILLVQLR